jgi:F5/8 type C domain
MSVNIFGASAESTLLSSMKASGVTKNYIDSKFITLTNNLATKVNRSGDKMIGDLNMGGHGLCDVKDPVNDNDVANKKFVLEKEETLQQFINKLFIKNSVGLVPNLTSNNKNKSGYYVSASSEFSKDFPAYQVFNVNKPGGWRFAGEDSNFWIQLQCPEVTKIHKFTIRGRNNEGGGGGERIFRWKLQGSIDKNVWDMLYDGHNEYINYDFKVVDVKPLNGYLYYRIFVDRAEEGNPGLSHWQIYSLDSII